MILWVFKKYSYTQEHTTALAWYTNHKKGKWISIKYKILQKTSVLHSSQWCIAHPQWMIANGSLRGTHSSASQLQRIPPTPLPKRNGKRNTIYAVASVYISHLLRLLCLIIHYQMLSGDVGDGANRKDLTEVGYNPCWTTFTFTEITAIYQMV